MATHDITIPVDLTFRVDTTTAEACLKVVELYMNQHPELFIECCHRGDGTVAHSFKEKHGEI